MPDYQGNETSQEDEGPGWFDFPGWRWAFFNIIIWLMPALIVLGVLLNILCFVTIFRNPKTFPKISRHNMLIVTACDIIVLSVAGTFYYHRYYQATTGVTNTKTFLDHQHDGVIACYSINYFIKFLLNGTPFFHVGLTTERMLAVVVPLKVKSIMTVKVNCILLLFLFLLGSVAPALWSVMQEYVGGRCDGIMNNPLMDQIDIIQYNFDFYVSKLALFMYLLIGCIVVVVSLKLQSLQADKLTSSNSDSVSRSKKRKTVGSCFVMIFMNVVFFLTHGPRAGMSLYEGYYIHNSPAATLTDAEIDLVYYILYGITFLHNTLDPLAYFIGTGFRKAFVSNLKDMAKLVACLPLRQRSSRQADEMA